MLSSRLNAGRTGRDLPAVRQHVRRVFLTADGLIFVLPAVRVAESPLPWRRSRFVLESAFHHVESDENIVSKMWIILSFREEKEEEVQRGRAPDVLVEIDLLLFWNTAADSGKRLLFEMCHQDSFTKKV